MATKSFYRILQVTPSNVRDNCVSVYIFSVEAFRATVKLLFLLSLVWLTEIARTFLNINEVTMLENQKTGSCYWPVIKNIQCSK